MDYRDQLAETVDIAEEAARFLARLKASAESTGRLIERSQRGIRESRKALRDAPDSAASSPPER